eukprot:246062-Alexandrium_andersonii.AAC.1
MAHGDAPRARPLHEEPPAARHRAARLSPTLPRRRPKACGSTKSLSNALTEPLPSRACVSSARRPRPWPAWRPTMP